MVVYELILPGLLKGICEERDMMVMPYCHSYLFGRVTRVPNKLSVLRHAFLILILMVVKEV